MHSGVRYAGQPGALVGPGASEKTGPNDVIMKLQSKSQKIGALKKEFFKFFLKICCLTMKILSIIKVKTFTRYLQKLRNNWEPLSPT